MTTTESTMAGPHLPDELLPLIPMVLTVWSDGVLADDELGAMCGRIGESAWLSEDGRRALLR